MIRMASIQPRLLLGVAALALGLSSCGQGHGPRPSPDPQPAPQPAPHDAEPSGQLSPAEYRAIKREYTLMKPLETAHDLAPAIRRVGPACDTLASPDTALVRLVRDDCREALAFFGALGDLQTAGSDCAGASQAAAAACVALRYRRLGFTIRLSTASGLLLNRELHKRGIRGLCALSIGIRPEQVNAFHKAATAATDAVTAIEAGDAAGFARAQQRVSDAMRGGGHHDALAGITRACRPRGAPAGPTTLPGGGIQA
jgi:hypothetical protein